MLYEVITYSGNFLGARIIFRMMILLRSFTMSTKKFFQLLVLVSVLVASFATTASAKAAYYCGTSVTVVSGDTLRKIV